MSKNKVFIYVERKSSFKLLVGVIAVLMALAFAVPAACLSPNQSYAKTNLNAVNDDENNIIIEKPEGLNLYIFDTALSDYTAILTEDHNVREYLKKNLDIVLGPDDYTFTLSFDETSGFARADIGSSVGQEKYELFLYCTVNIDSKTVGQRSIVDELYVCYTDVDDAKDIDADHILGIPEYLNGVHQDIPILSEEGDKMLPFVNGLNKFTNYPYAPVATITISGNVVDASDLPIAGASVSYKSDAAQSKNVLADVSPVITDANGHFEFVDFDPALLPVVISVAKDGYTFTDVHVTSDDIVGGKIVLKSSVVGNPVTPVNPASEETKLAETNDYMFAVVAGLVIIAIAAGTVFVIRRSKTN